MGQQTTSMNVTQTDDIRVSIDEVMNFNKGIVDKLMFERPHLFEDFRDLLVQVYIRGFLACAHHRQNDEGNGNGNGNGDESVNEGITKVEEH